MGQLAKIAEVKASLKAMKLPELADMAGDIVEQSVFMVGHILTEARRRFKDTQSFGAWRTEIFADRLPQRTAHNYMQLIRAFPDQEALGDRPQTGGYLIGGIEDTAARKRIIKKSDGKSLKEIKDMIEALNPAPEVEDEPEDDTGPVVTDAPDVEPEAPTGADKGISLQALAMEFSPVTDEEEALVALVMGTEPKQEDAIVNRMELILEYPELVASVFKRTMTIEAAEGRALEIEIIPEEVPSISVEKFTDTLFKLLPAKLRKEMAARDKPNMADNILMASQGALIEATATMNKAQTKVFMAAYGKVLNHQTVVFHYLMTDAVEKALAGKESV